MKLLCEKIEQEGIVLPGNILKVDNFINHMIDTELLFEMGKEFYNLFKDCNVTKILTVESSGIGIACATAQSFGNLPVVFAKKSKSSNIPDTLYSSHVHSYTHGNDYDMTVAKRMLSKGERVLIIDDFLATASAVKGLCNICQQAEVEVLGAGIVIEKGFQPGGNELRARGFRVESLAIIDSMEEGKIVFNKNSLK